MGTRTRGALLLVLLALLQAAGPRTGGVAELSPLLGVLVLLSAVGQAALVGLRTGRAGAAGVLLLYAVQVLVGDLVPPYAAWVVLWRLAAEGEPRRAVRETAVFAAATALVVVLGELRRDGAGLGGLLVAGTVVLALVAVLRRSEEARLAAVRSGAAAEERLRIARDLHDLVGHGLSAVAVQSSTARMALDAGDEATARAALAAVEGSSRSAMREMRELLGVLRESSDDNGPAPGLRDLPELVDRLRRPDAALTYDADGDVDAVPASVQLCAYRVVQEALTNAVRHAPGADVAVRVSAAARTLHVVVDSTGGGRGGGVGSGTGLDGMRTRVAAVGGTVTAGPTPGGWRVEAALPLEQEVSR